MEAKNGLISKKEYEACKVDLLLILVFKLTTTQFRKTQNKNQKTSA